MAYQYPTPSLTATPALPTAFLTLLLLLYSLQWPNSSSGHCCASYGPTYSAASPELLNNDQTPPPKAIAALPTALLTLLLPLNALPILNSFSFSYCCSFLRPYLLCCFPWMPYQNLLQLLLPSLMVLLTLLLPLNALPVTNSIFYSCCCSFLRPYLLCCFTWMPYQYPTPSLQPLQLFLTTYLLCCFSQIP